MTGAGRVALALAVLSGVAEADRPEGVCVELSVDFVPTDMLQIVAWIEKPDGTYIDTLYITHRTGRFGMGNRPGRSDFNTGSPMGDVFPYGRRIQTFPVWAHRHGLEFPAVVFQNGDENNLSHPYGQSSREAPPPYCRPIQPTEADWDAGTCASEAFTDKGKFSADLLSKYPPRADLVKTVNDDASVDLFRMMNPFDAVSQATPVGGTPTTAAWAAPQEVDYGSYHVFVETSKTYDFNATYNDSTFPSPTGIPWSDYGKAWRGQPSVVYQVPIVVAQGPTSGMTSQYVGYGDPHGVEGTLFPPDATITTDTPGSGASRMQLVSDGGDMYRVRVRARPELDSTPPAGLDGEPVLVKLGSRTATVAFPPGHDDGTAGTAAGYDVRIRASEPITLDNFYDSVRVSAAIKLDEAGNPYVDITGLLPETIYYVGIRPYDNCFNRGELVATARFTTLDRETSEVDWCFIATAAYGSHMANDVALLRQFRDAVLEHTVLGQLAVSTYYTFGPAVAGVIGESDLLRVSTRAMLAPVVQAVRGLSY